MNHYKIRLFQEADIELVVSIYSLYPSEKYPNEPELARKTLKDFVAKKESIIKGDRTIFVCESLGEGEPEIVGVAVFRTPNPEALLLPFVKTNKPVMLLSLFVKYKKRGIGKALLKEVEKETKNRSYTEIIVPSHTRWQESWTFYDRMSYERVGQIDMDGLVQVWRKEL